MSVATAARPRVTTIGAPVAGVALVATGAAMWGADGALRAPLVAHWSSWTIVLYEHVTLTTLLAGVLLRRRADIARIPRRAWLSVVGVSWGGSALATLAFISRVGDAADVRAREQRGGACGARRRAWLGAPNAGPSGLGAGRRYHRRRQ